MGKEDLVLPASLIAGNEGNQRGVDIEQKVAGLIRGLSQVVSVTETEKWSREDKDMIDLIVTLDGDIELVVQKVFIQIKASTKGVEHFEEELSARLKRKKGNSDPVDRKTWMLENHRILLVGDIKMTKSHNHSHQVTDEEIIVDFEKQLQEIENYERSKTKT